LTEVVKRELPPTEYKNTIFLINRKNFITIVKLSRENTRLNKVSLGILRLE